MASSPWQKMRNLADDSPPGERGVFAVLLGPPIVEAPRHFAHLSWQGTSYVLRDYLNNMSRKQGDDLNLADLWRSASVRVPCKGRLRRSVEDHAFWEDALRRLTDEYASTDSEARKAPRPIGLAKGVFEVPPAFFEPLPDDFLASFHGEDS